MDNQVEEQQTYENESLEQENNPYDHPYANDAQQTWSEKKPHVESRNHRRSAASVRNEHWNEMCIVGFVVSIVSLFISAYGVIAVVGIILSKRGRDQARISGQATILGTAGMIIGGISLGVMVISLLYILVITKTLTGIL